MTVEWERGGTPRGAALSPIVEPGKRISRHPALLKASRLSHAQAVARLPPATDSPAQTAGSPHRNLTLPAVGRAVGCAVSLSGPRSSGTLIPESLVRSHAARLNRFATPNPLDDTLPLDFRLLEIDQKTDGRVEAYRPGVWGLR